MEARQIIAALRDGRGLPADAARWFAAGLASGEVTDAQAGAFAMAVLIRGLSDGERVGWTLAMRDSGQVLGWNLPGPVIDKHSTGGIGDCTSLLLAPALAACGAYVPMISGRGLGHTGGTLDKLESIPGYRTDQPVDQLRQILSGVGCAIVGASADIAPADRRLYGVRDVTGTVESVDLITASILSKKLAAGLEALVLDVKCGSGAFMKTLPEARALARALVDTANGAGCATAALVTDMSQPLAAAAGNALEVVEVMETLTGQAIDQPLWDLTLALGGEALVLAGLADDALAGEDMIDEALASGRAAETFGRMVAAQGGPHDFVERFPDRLPAAAVVVDVCADEAGFVAAIDGEALGHCVVRLGGGRLKGGDRINPAVGLSDLAPVGEPLARGEAFALVHAATPEEAARAVAEVKAAYRIGETAPDEPDLILERIV
ncbi:MAG: thymidine phosphorylase [Proteobacteria bacterium]|nr:thymidine phosphorylase [Pseudomonadota bacterium]MBS0572335.1 thymidine phosphorylase [Pseudomonadota bacterium]